jgi:hypothetical protein
VDEAQDTERGEGLRGVAWDCISGLIGLSDGVNFGWDRRGSAAWMDEGIWIIW